MGREGGKPERRPQSLNWFFVGILIQAKLVRMSAASVLYVRSALKLKRFVSVSHV